MPSFDGVNYAIRPNKAVERRIVFSVLMRLQRVLDFSTYRYLGLGSLWFVDFLMAHKLLHISSMISIEQSEMGFKRSAFNRPLNCIEVLQGESSLVLPDLNLAQLPSIVWFDYDSSIGGPVLNDIGQLTARCAPNSVVIVTINAKRGELPTKDENEEPINFETSLRRIAGDLVPTPLAANRFQITRYPKLLCGVLANHFQATTVGSGRAEAFTKLFDLEYSDGTPMITVGGILSALNTADLIRQAMDASGWEGIVAEPISVPPLTIKEKLALDRMFPSENPPTDAQMNDIGFQLKREQIETYHRYYKYYPMFGEFVL